jgi:hypothetical protein
MLKNPATLADRTGPKQASNFEKTDFYIPVTVNKPGKVTTYSKAIHNCVRPVQVDCSASNC